MDAFFQCRSQLPYQFVIKLANVLIEAGLDVETRTPRFSKIEPQSGKVTGKDSRFGGNVVVENCQDVTLP